MSCMTFFLMTSLSGAGTLGTVENEIETLEGEVAQAQNERDALLLRPGAEKNLPEVQAKTEALEGKKKVLGERLKDLNTRPKAVAKDPSQLVIDADFSNRQPDPNDRDDTPRGNAPPPLPTRVEVPARSNPTPPREGFVLSGEGIQSEITYSKKDKKSKPGTDQSPEVNSSDIHYPKKKTK